MIHKKMFIRDLNKHKEGFIGSIIIIAIGLMIFTSFSLVLINLSLEKEKFYKEQNFADVFIKVKEMPYKDIDKLKNIKGIKHVEGRLIKDVRLYKNKKAIDKYIRLISYDFGKDFIVNDVELIEPKEIKLDNSEIIIDNKFIEANGLNLDDEIEIITDSNVEKLNIKGFGRSPEFIYALRTASDIYPEPKKFGIGFLNKEYMSKLFEEGSNVNDITLILEEGTNFNELKNILEGKLEKYGLFYIIERKDQVSNLLLTEEIKGLKSMSKTVPIMFLMVSSMILYIILKRMIESKRGQIGILKAMGYKKIEIQMHYISYSLFVGILGGILGSISGYFLSIPFTNIYSEFFNMPNIKATFSFKYLIYSIVMSLFFSLSAGYMGTKKILDLTPANSLRKEVPIFNKKLFIEKSKFLWNMFNVQGKMAVRNIKRDIKRSIFIIFTISFTGALLIFSLSMRTMSEEMLFDKYKNEEVYKAKIDFDSYYSEDDILREFKNKYNLKRVEGVLNIPAKAKFKWYEKDISITAINDDSMLYRILDSQKNRVNLSKDGIYISQRLSKLLDAKVNDEIILSFVDNSEDDNEKKIRINGVIPQYLGIGVYSNLDYAKTFLDSKKIINTVLIDANKEVLEEIRNDYFDTSRVTSIKFIDDIVAQNEELMQSNTFMMAMMSVIGVVTIFSVVYNSAIIQISERKRELSSMMVLGMSSKEVSLIVSFEQWCLTIIGAFLSILVAKMMLVGLSDTLSNDVYTMPTTISYYAFVVSFIMIIISVRFAQFISYLKIKKFDIVEVLKDRE